MRAGFAPDGCLCDNGSPTSCNYKQGDGDVAIHDWTLEETLSAVMMQAELLLISRNTSAISQFLPLFLRTSNLIESRRDTTVNMFLTGPSTNVRTMKSIHPSADTLHSVHWLYSPHSNTAAGAVLCRLEA